MRLIEEKLRNYKKIFVLDEYRDKAGNGSQEYFDSLEEAINYAKKEWEHLSGSDKLSYLRDPAGFFRVTENEVVEEEGDCYPSLEPLNVLWDAFKYQKILDLKDAIDGKEKYIKQLEEEIAVELYDDEEELAKLNDDIKELHDEIKEFQNEIEAIKKYLII